MNRQSSTSEDATTGSRKSVLLVDDDPGIRSVARKILERGGFLVSTAEGGEEAIRLFESKPQAFDAVVLDMVLPDMSGVRVFEGLVGLRPEIGIVLCTGYAEVSELQELIQRGVSSVLYKPFRMEELRSAVNQAIARSRKS